MTTLRSVKHVKKIFTVKPLSPPAVEQKKICEDERSKVKHENGHKMNKGKGETEAGEKENRLLCVVSGKNLLFTGDC